MTQPPPRSSAPPPPASDGVRVVRAGDGANCSSVGSVVDLLFVAGALGGALLVAVTAALDDEERRQGEAKDEGEGADASEG